jgi:hypothetical protein
MCFQKNKALNKNAPRETLMSFLPLPMLAVFKEFF